MTSRSGRRYVRSTSQLRGLSKVWGSDGFAVASIAKEEIRCIAGALVTKTSHCYVENDHSTSTTDKCNAITNSFKLCRNHEANRELWCEDA